VVDFPPRTGGFSTSGAHCHDGRESVRFDPTLMSVPISALWSG
jgi:hypothetical protein